MNIDQFIKKYYEEMTNDEIAEKFGTTESSIRRHMRKLGLSRNGVPATRIRETKEVGLKEKLYQFLKKSKVLWDVESLSTHFDVGVGRIRDTLRELEREGKNVHVSEAGVGISKEIPKEKPTVIDVSKFKHKHYRFGLTADNHLGSKYERMDVLNALFDIWASQGIRDVYQCGNMIEGERHSKFDIHIHGMQNQVDYFVENWPKRKGITTYYVTGDDHEGWYVQDEGVNIGKFIEMASKEAGRTDLVFLGHMEHDIVLKAPNGSSIMRVLHAGGGSSYATSYSVQKIVESYQGGEKPHILLVGHYHKAEYGYPREVHVVQAGCTKDQDSFLRKNKIAAHVGGWTIDFDQSEDGIVHNFRVQFHAFYDKGFYNKAWKYKW